MNRVSSPLLIVIAVTSVLVGSGVAEEQYVSICEGETITLSCNQSGNSNITWNFDQSNETLQTCDTPCDYNLTDASQNDSGLYNCSVDGIDVNSYNVVIATPPADDPVCSVNVNSMSGNGGGVVYVRKGDNITLECLIREPSSWTIGWSNQDNRNATTIGNVTRDRSPATYFIHDVDVDEEGREYTCEAVYNDTCFSLTSNCTVGPIYVITEGNFRIERDNETIYVGDNVTLECVTEVTETMTRWINGSGSTLIIENITDVNGNEFTCELFAINDHNVTLDTRVVMITVVDPTTVSMTSSPSTPSTPAESTGSDITTNAVTDRSTTNMTKAPTSKAPLNVAAVAGGAAGGAVALLIIIVIIVIVCRSNETDGEGVKRRPKKSKEGSKKHRSGILSYRHKQPLFSTPYADDDDDAEKAGHTAPADTDVDTMITEYRPKSKIASQIRVDLDVDNGDEGTVENGFAPTQLATADEDEGPYSMGLVEGRLGIMGPGTFAAANTDSGKIVDLPNQNQNNGDDDETETAMDDQYTKVYKPNNPGDMSFDNMTYGPIEGVDDVKKELCHDEEQGADRSQSQEDTHSDTNETDNADDIDSPNGGGDVDRVGDEGDNENKSAKVEQKDTDITEQNHTADRESTAYAEIP